MPGALESRVAVGEAAIQRLEKIINGNGQPGLESKLMQAIGTVEGRLKGHIESVERHAQKNIEQGDGDVLAELETERVAREKQHEDNQKRQDTLGKKVDRLTTIVTLMMGGLMAFKALEDFGIIHIASR